MKRSLAASIKLILTLHCDESTRIISEGLDRRLTFAERWAVRLHYLSCWSCRRFRRQLNLLRAAARAEGAPNEASPSLSPEARRRILDVLEGE